MPGLFHKLLTSSWLQFTFCSWQSILHRIIKQPFFPSSLTPVQNLQWFSMTWEITLPSIPLLVSQGPHNLVPTSSPSLTLVIANNARLIYWFSYLLSRMALPGMLCSHKLFVYFSSFLTITSPLVPMPDHIPPLSCHESKHYFGYILLLYTLWYASINNIVFLYISFFS